MIATAKLWHPLPRTMARDEESQAKATRVARARRRRANQRGRTHRGGWTYDFDTEKHSSAAEDAVAEQIGRPWDDTPEPDYDGDVGPGVQVRWTRRPNGCLPIHLGPPYDRWGREDPDFHVFFLVCGPIARLRIVGWIEGWEGKLAQFWRADLRNPCLLVPQGVLHAHDPELPDWP